MGRSVLIRCCSFHSVYLKDESRETKKIIMVEASPIRRVLTRKPSLRQIFLSMLGKHMTGVSDFRPSPMKVQPSFPSVLGARTVTHMHRHVEVRVGRGVTCMTSSMESSRKPPALGSYSCVPLMTTMCAGRFTPHASVAVHTSTCTQHTEADATFRCQQTQTVSYDGSTLLCRCLREIEIVAPDFAKSTVCPRLEKFVLVPGKGPY